jgi:cytochrome c oxidase subunit 2
MEHIQKLKQAVNKRTVLTWTFALLPLLFILFTIEPVYAQGIGEGAKKAMEGAQTVAEPLSKEDFSSLVKWLQILTLLVVVGAAVLLGWVAKLADIKLLRSVSANAGNGWGMLLFGIAFLGLVIYEIAIHSDRLYIIVNAASEHGVKIDQLMHITLALTLIVFFVIQTVLFYFVWKYRSRPGIQATYYADNHKLEQLWTVVPAIVLFVIVGYGVVVWNQVHYPKFDKVPKEIELVAEQFQWRIRYAGDDGKLGRTFFRLTSGTNPLAMDSTDVNAADDRIPIKKELVLLKGQPYKFRIRAKDVLHGFYMPHFRVNIYAVPGMPTQAQMVPIKSTKEMQKIYGDKFEYELACSQLCGNAHYNMKVSIVVVETQAELDEWLKKQPTFVVAEAEAPAIPAAESKAEEKPSASVPDPVGRPISKL